MQNLHKSLAMSTKDKADLSQKLAKAEQEKEMYIT
jgi:hypothetical protein